MGGNNEKPKLKRVNVSFKYNGEKADIFEKCKEEMEKQGYDLTLWIHSQLVKTFLPQNKELA